MQNISRYSAVSKIPSSISAKMSRSSTFFHFIIQAENCFSRLTRNPSEMAKLHQVTMQCRKEAWELEIIRFFFPLFASENFYPFVLSRDTLNTAKPRFALIPEGMEKSAHESTRNVEFNLSWTTKLSCRLIESLSLLKCLSLGDSTKLASNRSVRGGYFSRC